jgi:hypothetical protein
MRDVFTIASSIIYLRSCLSVQLPLARIVAYLAGSDYTTYDGVSKSFRTGSMTKYPLTFGITHCEATERVMVAKLTRLTHRIAIQMHLVAESCTMSRSRSRRPVRKLLDTPSYIDLFCFVLGLYCDCFLKDEQTGLSGDFFKVGIEILNNF